MKTGCVSISLRVSVNSANAEWINVDIKTKMGSSLGVTWCLIVHTHKFFKSTNALYVQTVSTPWVDTVLQG